MTLGGRGNSTLYKKLKALGVCRCVSVGGVEGPAQFVVAISCQKVALRNFGFMIEVSGIHNWGQSIRDVRT